MDKRLVILGFILLVFGGIARAASLEGECSSTSVQCELSVNNLKLCNDSGVTHTYKTYAEGPIAQWVNIIPSTVTLAKNECRELRVYTIADCYAEPGSYKTDIVVKNDISARVTCNINIKQGHFVDVDITPTKQNATQCEAKEYDVKLTNRSLIPNQLRESVRLGLNGLDSGWFTLGKTDFMVAKGTPEHTNLRVQAPCDAKLGTYSFDAVAYLQNPNFFSADSAQYVLGQGQEFEIGIGAAGSHEACLEEATSAEIEITNSGKMDDIVKLGMSAPSWVGLSEKEFALGAGQSKKARLDFRETSERAGDYEISIIAKSGKFDYTATETFKFTLSDCYGITLEKTGGAENACAEEGAKYSFELRNTGTKDVDARVSVEGINASLSGQEFSLKAGEKAAFTASLGTSGYEEGAKVSRNDIAIEILMDSSGSMVESINSHNKMDAAKNAIVSFANSITEVQLGLRVFGQGAACEASQLLVPVSKLDIAKITDKIEGMSPRGKTPLANALDGAASDFKAGAASKYVILVSDGKETCKGNVADAAKRLKGKGIVVYAIGFDIDQEGMAQLKQIVETTGGEYYDVKSADSLSAVFSGLAKKLNIELATPVQKAFTVKVSADKAMLSKGYTLGVEDCYNILLLPPELNVCRGVASTNSIAINNLGTKKQELSLSILPKWVKAEGKVSIDGMGSALVPITVNVPNDASEAEMQATAESAHSKATEKKPINYLSEASCFGVDLIIMKYRLDVAECEGTKQVLSLENRGVVAQEVTLSFNKGWAYPDRAKVKLGKGERTDVYFIISPPADITPEEGTIEITAKTDRGFVSTAEIKLNIKGREVKEEVVDIKVSGVRLDEMKKEGAVDAVVSFELNNNSTKTLMITSAEAMSYSAVFNVESTTIEANSSTKVTMYLDLPEDFSAARAIVPVVFKTNEGTFIRDITVELGKSAEGAGNETEAEPVAIGTGLVSLVSMQNIVILVLLLIVVALVVFAAVSAIRKPKEEAPVPMFSVLEEIEKPAKRARKASGRSAKRRKGRK
ncbi:MAG: VWA domain-containing protein [Candidatus Diapherotrites archaeon]